MKSRKSKHTSPGQKLRASPTLQYAGIGLWIILLIVLPFNIVYHFNSEYAYVDGYFVNYLDFVVHIVDILVFVLLAWMIVVGRVWKFRMVQISWGILALFFVVHNLVFLDQVVFYGSLRVLLYGLCLVGGIAWFGCMLRDRKKQGVKRKVLEIGLLSAILIAGIVQSIIGIVQFLSNRMLGLDFLGESVIQVGGYATSSVYLSDGLHLRAYGTFPHPNVLGGFLVAVLAVGLFGSAVLKGKWRFAVLASLTVVLAGILVTWSRTSIVLAGATLCLWVGKELYERYGRAVLKVFVSGVALLVLCFGVWVMYGGDSMGSSLRERFVNQSTSSDVSVKTRRDLNDRAWDMIRDNPIFGVGTSKFISELADDPVNGEDGIRVMQPAHNIPLLLLSEIGIFGVSCLIAVAVILFRKVKWSLYALTCLLFYMGVGCVDHYVWSLPQGIGLVFIFLAGCLLFKRGGRDSRVL